MYFEEKKLLKNSGEGGGQGWSFLVNANTVCPGSSDPPEKIL